MLLLLKNSDGENHQPVANHWQTLSHKIVSSTPRNLNTWVTGFDWWLTAEASLALGGFWKPEHLMRIMGLEHCC